MNAVPHPPLMSLADFFRWPGHQDGRFEFDGKRPVAMTGGNINHGLIAYAIVRLLRDRSRGTIWYPYGPDAGIHTIDNRIRYPDALVSAAVVDGEAYTVPDPVVVFEVVSKTSGRIDRVEKAAEYEAVASILRYVIVARTRVHLTVLKRESGDRPFSSSRLGAGQVLLMPEIGVELPVDAIYEDVDLTRPAR